MGDKNEDYKLLISFVDNYNIQKRGGVGVIGIKTSKRNGNVVGAVNVTENDQIIMVSDKGQIIRVNINQIRIAGRATQGVSVFKIPDTDKIVSVSRIKDILN